MSNKPNMLLYYPVSVDLVSRDELDDLSSKYLMLSVGGSISGDVDIYQKSMSILSGNFLQSNSDNVLNYSAKNAFIQAEEARNSEGDSYGPAYTGTKGYCILSVNIANNTIKLSGDISAINNLFEGKYVDHNGNEINSVYATPGLNILYGGAYNARYDLSGIKFSFSLFKSQGTANIKVLSVLENSPNFGIISVHHIPQELVRAASNRTEEDMIDLFLSDDNSIYAIGYPELGNQIIENFYAQHGEGGSVRAIGKYTHAEGRDNIADVRYSHVEGSHNTAGGMASHVEGFFNIESGRFGHVEGYNNKSYSTIDGNDGAAIHVEGSNNVLEGNNGSHVEGAYNVGNGAAIHVEGLSSEIGENVEAKTITFEELGKLRGTTTAAHAEGIKTVARDFGAHAEGIATYAYGPGSHAEGVQTSAMGECSFAGGMNAIAANEHNTSFVWNSSFNQRYSSQENCSFNINPLSGVNGFYIGTDTLSSIISSAIENALIAHGLIP